MTAKQLIKQLQKYIKNNPEGEDDKIVIAIEGDSYGGTPNVEVDGICYGFAWNKGFIFLMSDSCELNVSKCR